MNNFGQIAYNQWEKLPERFPNIELDIFQIMPNHLHGIIVLKESVSSNIIGTATELRRATARVAPTRAWMIGDIVGAYKSLVVKECLNIYKSRNEMMGKLWQRNYYEYIIRSAHSYEIISDYIITNPSNWHDDKFFVE